MTRKVLSISAFAALLCFASFSAQAAEGCGQGAHRGPDGRCYLNGRVVVVAPPPVVVVGPPVGVVCGPGLRWHPGRRRCSVYSARLTACSFADIRESNLKLRAAHGRLLFDRPVCAISLVGTKPTNRAGLAMPVDRGRSERNPEKINLGGN